MSDTEDIKNKINIVDLVGEYVQLKKAGVNFKSPCPFHEEKTPSFVVSPSKQIWHCFGCGLGGDHFEFIKEIEGVEFREALEILAQRAGVVLEKPTRAHLAAQDKKKVLYELNELAAKYFAKVLKDSPIAARAREYLQDRGFKQETVDSWQIGYAPDSFHAFDEFVIKKGYQKKEALEAGLLAEKDNEYFDRFRDRIMFPLFDIHGRVVGFTARILDSSGLERNREVAGSGHSAKYINSPETLIYQKSELVFGLNRAKTEIRKAGEAVVVEGNVDVITAHEAGFTNVVGSSGTAFTEKQLQALKRFTENLSFAFDTDEAGLMAVRKAVEQALKIGFNVKVVTIPKEVAKDPDELIRSDVNLWAGAVEGAQVFLDFYFASTFARIDLTGSLGKKQAARELLPLIALLPDEIDRSHYIQLLAQKLGVSEDVLRDALKGPSAQSQQAQGEQARKKTKRLTKLEILERRVLGLLLKFSKNLYNDWSDLVPEDFSVPVLREIFRKCEGAVSDSGFEFEVVFKEDEDLSSESRLLVFGIENELAQIQEWDLGSVKKEFIASLKQEILRRQMKDLTHKIQLAESEGRQDVARELSSEHHNLSKELSSFINY